MVPLMSGKARADQVTRAECESRRIVRERWRLRSLRPTPGRASTGTGCTGVTTGCTSPPSPSSFFARRPSPFGLRNSHGTKFLKHSGHAAFP